MKCHYCDATMVKANHPRPRSGGRPAVEQRWVCPVDKSEVQPDERGHLKRAAGSKHPPGIRSYTVDELELLAGGEPSDPARESGE